MRALRERVSRTPLLEPGGGALAFSSSLGASRAVTPDERLRGEWSGGVLLSTRATAPGCHATVPVPQSASGGKGILHLGSGSGLWGRSRVPSPQSASGMRGAGGRGAREGLVALGARRLILVDHVTRREARRVEDHLLEGR